jgi:hypothetical protein
MTLQEIIDALENADGPSQELDGAIEVQVRQFEAAKTGLPRKSWAVWKNNGATVYDGNTGYDAYPVTKSVDAAIALCERVLPEYGWDLASKTSHILNCLNPEYGKPIGEYPHWAAVAKTSSKKFEDGATPAIALCIAILRAKLQGTNQND